MIDLTGLDFSLSMEGSGSAGSFYKSIDSDGNYYKVSYIIRDGFGYESINKVLVSRLANLFGFSNTGYELVEAKVRLVDKVYETFLCKSANFKKVGESRVSLESYCDLSGLRKGSLKILIFKPFFRDLMNMLFLDYLIDNRDRHGANIELLSSKNGVRLAPIYDCGSSLLAPLQYNEERLSSFDFLHDGPVNNFLISMWWSDVLAELKSLYYTIPIVDLDALVYSDLYVGFKDGYQYILDKEVEMIKRRYAHAKKIFNTP